MKYILCATLVNLVLVLALQHEGVSCQEQRVVRRLVKVGANGARVRVLGARAVAPEQVVAAEKGAVSEISSKEAANFGQRSSTNETATTTTTTTSTPSPSSTIASSTSTSTTTTAPTTTSAKPSQAPTPVNAPIGAANSQPLKATGSAQEVELLSSAPSSWQSMMAVEAPTAMLVALENAPVSELASVSSSERHLLENLPAQPSDFLRGPTKGGKLVVQTQSHEIKEQSKVTQQQQQQQQAFFYPRKPAQVFSKTSSQTKGVKWYQPTTSTTPKPAPLLQEYAQEQYQQQQQVEYGPAPLGEAEPFAFDFKTLDNSGNGQYRKEESDKNGVVRGSYGYTDASGIYRHVEYIADADGFRANIKSNEPGLIGETQPASIQYSAGSVPAASSQRFSAPSRADNSDWIPEALQPNTATSTVNNDNINNYQDAPVGELAQASPNFESSHKPERIRLPRNYRN